MPTLKLLEVDKLLLDVANPRIARLIEKYGTNPTADQINLALGAGSPTSSEGGTTFQSLKESIRTNGGIINPIIVNCRPDGIFVVIEGNTRAAIYREFKKQKVIGDWNVIPSLVYDNLELASQDAIRLQAHLVGPRAWDPYSKAKYLNELRNSDHLTINQIIDFCGGKRQEVLSLIQAYNDIETYYRPILSDESEFDQTRFSAFVELQKGPILTALSEGGYTKENFAGWVNDRLIDPLATVRDLPRILRNPNSKTKFFSVGAREALKELVVNEVGENFSSIPMDSLVKELINRLRNISHASVREMSTNADSEKTQNIFSLKDEIDQLCSDIETRNE
ncbi:MAG: hypothetical protein EPN93_03940 [Spirochaetes bacterium]|nr:MAG: hypothetical protein EPN93_03940 [Spirochaetota bacterium]